MKFIGMANLASTKQLMFEKFNCLSSATGSASGCYCSC